MGLQKTIISDNGLEIQDAYFRIDEYSCNGSNLINARIRAYVSRDLQKQGANFITGSEDVVSFIGQYFNNSINTKKQCYDYIKTLSKYTDAIDC